MDEGEGRTQSAKEHENVLDDASALYLRDVAHGMVCEAKQNSLVCSPQMSGFIMWRLHDLPSNVYVFFVCVSKPHQYLNS